ncbi:DUF4293 domain-containing protein [Namhaeicola litoreus]|uniref:DUF4293 domain-containing protein n=1 Tax=Namhaeicola litoreus TaxID=1052145 RepID=A0ABW3Y4J3_9FLAO
MIQRIQTLYFLMAAICSGVLSYILTTYIYNGVEFKLTELLVSENSWFVLIGGLFILSSLLSLITVFLYSNRKNQIVLTRVNILINFFLLGIIVYQLLALPGEASATEKGIGAFLPLLIIVLLSLANKAVIKDERLVKSVDRLR